MKRIISSFIIILTISQPLTAEDKIEIPWVPQTKDIMVNIGEFSEERLDPSSIKMLIWNMYKGTNPTWEDDYAKLSEGQDILVNQEMFLNEMMTGVFKSHEGYGYQTATSFMYLPSQTRTGVTTASKVKPVNFKHQRSRVIEPVINTPKMSFQTFYKMEGTDEILMVVNIHAINFVSVYALSVQLKDLAKDIKKHKGPVVFAGDFNTWSAGKIFIMRKIINRGLKMKEVKFKNDHRKKVFGKYIDYVFIKGLEVVKAKSFGNILGSDHTPMQVELKFNL